jgi:hypothetical protein
MHRAIVCLLVAPLIGCGAVMPGYSPDGPPNLAPALQPFHGGHLDDKGVYAVSDAERGLSCSKLTGSMQITISRIKDSGDRPRPGALTMGMQVVETPFTGQGANLDVDEELKFARARLKAYNGLLAEKKCQTLDIAGI